MGQLSYIVVSTPRSATGWASQVLTAMGLQCGHETYYNLRQRQHTNILTEGVWGDSSWLAVPFIKDLPTYTTVVHLVRNPWHTIASFVGLGWFDWQASMVGLEYRMFMEEHLIGRIPDDSPLAGEVRRAAHFWMTWHMMIELYAKARSDLQYVRCQAESPVAAESMYRAITGKDADVGLVIAADRIDLTYNSRGYAKPDVWLRRLDPHVVELANRYGYPG
ncbi:hypothetical protein LCGC14_1098220 [marine sediment metagenome]|uniref:Sulfotransferase domain-containing protein n=1 Tax=marine sediment metagenome TaxID=412755 RepID=A0A0F9QGC8_9ZZZZ